LDIYGGAIVSETSYIETSTKKMKPVRDKRAGVLSMAEGWYEKREGGRQRPIQLVVVVSIGTANEDVTTAVNKQQIMIINPHSH